MLIAYVLVLFAIVGLLIYLLVTRADVKEIGRITFAVGLFWTVAATAHMTKVL